MGDDESATTSVSTLIREALHTFSSAERKVARAMLADYPVAGLETVAELAARSNVSPPTVIRFVSRLGFSGYPPFQRLLMREVQVGLGSPLARYENASRPASTDDYLEFAQAAFTERITESFHAVPRSEFISAVTLLSDAKKSVGLLGGRFSHTLAIYIGAHLELLRAGTFVVPADEITRLTVVEDSGKANVYVIFDYRRYDLDTIHFAQNVAERGSDVILFTDRWLSPIADVASVVIPAQVESSSPFDSLLPAMALVESLVAGVAAELGPSGRKRLGDIEALRTQP